MAEAESIKTVILNDHHIGLGGRMVPFAGYALPVQYPTGIVAEHKWTREHAGLFDVSHMGPSFLRLRSKSGDPEADHAAIAALIEPLVSGDILRLKPGQIRYSVLLNAAGGVLDDLMIARSHEAGTLYIIVNAATKENDFALIAAAAGEGAHLERSDTHALLALQGPEAAAVIAGIVPEAAGLGFMTHGVFAWQGAALTVSRSGYTGEDGFEILVDPDHASRLWTALTADARVKPIGLGARDSLRLEAGLPLYGRDLDESTSPIEAGLAFAVSKRRREAGDLRGAARLAREGAGTLSRLRVGLLVEGAPAREGAQIVDAEGTPIGVVTSGGFSPTLGRAIATGFVPPGHSEPGTKLGVVVRGREQAAQVTPLPFVPHRYFKPTPRS